MVRRLVVPALSGWAIIAVWMLLSNGLLGLQARIAMRSVIDEPVLYAALKVAIPAPGGYTVNPPLTGEGRFPGGEPVYSVRTGGIGHEAAGRLLVEQLVTSFLACLLAAWLLAAATTAGRANWVRRALIVAALGLFLVLTAALPEHGIGGLPLGSTLLLAGQQLVAWILAGLAMAVATRPRPILAA